VKPEEPTSTIRRAVATEIDRSADQAAGRLSARKRLEVGLLKDTFGVARLRSSWQGAVDRASLAMFDEIISP